MAASPPAAGAGPPGTGRHAAAWVPALWTSLALPPLLLLMSTVNRLAPDAYMVRRARRSPADARGLQHGRGPLPPQLRANTIPLPPPPKTHARTSPSTSPRPSATARATW
jgi:hypothetical protein